MHEKIHSALGIYHLGSFLHIFKLFNLFNDKEQNIKVRADGSQLKSVAIDLARTR